jgi:hypothetical protein
MQHAKGNFEMQTPELDLMERLAEEVAMYVDAHWTPDEYVHLRATFAMLTEFSEYQKQRQRPLPHYVSLVLQHWPDLHH